MDSNFTFNKKMRLIGYYNKSNQTMYEENKYIEEARHLADLLNKSFISLRKNKAIDSIFKSILNSNAVFILKDEEGNLFAYFPCKNIARISNVVYNKKEATQIPFEYKSWFTPGDEIETKIPQDKQNKRYFITTPGSDFLITNNQTKRTLPLDWDESTYISIKNLSRLINDEWVTLYEYYTEEDCDSCDGYDYSNCDMSKCKNDCERCRGRKYVCNDSCFNHRYKKALRLRLNYNIINKQLADLLKILEITAQPETKDSILFAQYNSSLIEAENHCKFLSDYFDISNTIIDTYISNINICRILIDGRDNFKEENSIAIYIDGKKIFYINNKELRFHTKGILFWKTHHLQSKGDIYNKITNSIATFDYKIKFDTEETKNIFTNQFHKILAIHLKSKGDCHIIENTIVI